MNKIFALPAFLLLCGCTAHNYPQTKIHAFSNEKNTNIFLNDEYQGSENADLMILNKESKTAYVYGKKKNCKDSKLKIAYKFDMGVFWILDLNNIPRLLTWDVWKVDDAKNLYNVTPICED